MKNRSKGGRSLVEGKAHYITHNQIADWKHLLTHGHSVALWFFFSTQEHRTPAATVLHSEPGAAGMFLYPTAPSITYSICLFAYISFDKANLCNLNQWNNHWPGLKETQYGSVTFLCRPRGLFVLRGARVPPPLPPNAQTGANGHISHLLQRPSEHKQLCLPPQPFVLTTAIAPCPSRGPSCIISVEVGGTLLTAAAEDEVKSGSVGVLRLLSCSEKVLLHYTSVLRDTQSR